MGKAKKEQPWGIYLILVLILIAFVIYATVTDGASLFG